MTPPVPASISTLARQRWRIIRRLLRGTVALSLILLSHAGSTSVSTTVPPKPPQRVLVLYSDDRLLPANIAIDEAMRATFATNTSSPVEFYSEFFDRTRFPGELQEQYERNFLRDKYQQHPPHLVVAVSGAASAFTLKYHTEVFAGAPVVYCSAPGDSPPPELRDASAL